VAACDGLTVGLHDLGGLFQPILSPGGGGLNPPVGSQRRRLGGDTQLCCFRHGEGNCRPPNQQPNPDQQLGDQNLCPTTVPERTALPTTRPGSWQRPKHIWPPPRWGSHRQPPSSHLASCGQLLDHPGRDAGCCRDRRLPQHQHKVLPWLRAGDSCSPAGKAAAGRGDALWWEEGKLWDQQPQGESSISDKRRAASMT